MHAVRWIRGTGCVFGQGAAGQAGGAPALLVPPPAILLEAHQGNHLPNRWRLMRLRCLLRCLCTTVKRCYQTCSLSTWEAKGYVNPGTAPSYRSCLAKHCNGLSHCNLKECVYLHVVYQCCTDARCIDVAALQASRQQQLPQELVLWEAHQAQVCSADDQSTTCSCSTAAGCSGRRLIYRRRRCSRDYSHAGHVRTLDLSSITFCANSQQLQPRQVCSTLTE